MALSCGAKVLKYGLFGFNLLFVIAGLVCVGVGVSLVVSPAGIEDIVDAFQKQANNTTAELSTIPVIVRNLGIALSSGGGIILLIAFFGCCGAVKEWRPLLTLYAIFLMIIMAVEITAAIFAAVHKTAIKDEIKDFMRQSLEKYGGNDTAKNEMRVIWDKFMTNSDCCGVNTSHEDDRGFRNSSWKLGVISACGQSAAIVRYPATCCVNPKQEPTPQLCQSYKYCDFNDIKGDCFDKLKLTVESKTAIIIGVGAAVGALQIIGIIFSLCLCRAISNHD